MKPESPQFDSESRHMKKIIVIAAVFAGALFAPATASAVSWEFDSRDGWVIDKQLVKDLSGMTTQELDSLTPRK